MKKVTINLDDAVYQFYQKVGNSAQRPVEQVISDALFKLAGELSLEALQNLSVCKQRDFLFFISEKCVIILKNREV